MLGSNESSISDFIRLSLLSKGMAEFLFPRQVRDKHFHTSVISKPAATRDSLHFVLF